MLLLCSSALKFGLPDADEGLSQLTRLCVEWLVNWAVKVWPTREFALLPEDPQHEVLEKLLQSLTVENCVAVLRDSIRILVRRHLDKTYVTLLSH